MANKKQKITTQLDAESKGLNDALKQAQKGLKETANEAKNTGKALQNTFDGGLQTAPKNLANVGNVAKKSNAAVSNATAGLAKYGNAAALAATTAIAGFTALTRHFSQMQTEAQSLGTTVEGLQRLDAAARATNTSSEGLHSAYSRFVQTLGSAQKGSAKAEKALSKLGLTSKDLSEGGEKAFLKAAAALGAIGSETERNAASMAVFGNATRDTQAALAECVATGQSMAGIVTTKQVEQYKRLATAIDGAKDSLWNLAGVALSPAAGGLADVLDTISGNWTNTVDKGPTNQTEIAEMEQWNSDHGYDAQQNRKRQEAARKRREAARQRYLDLQAEEEKISQLQRETARDEARKKGLEEMRRASLTPEQRAWEDFNKGRGEAIAKKRLETGWSQQEAETWAQKVYDPENMPTQENIQTMPHRGRVAMPQNMPISQPVAMPRQGVGLDAILRAILDLKANTYIVK